MTPRGSRGIVSYVKQYEPNRLTRQTLSYFMKQKKDSVNTSLEQLGQKVRLKRGSEGLRDTAKTIKVSPATLSRIERGFMSDIDTLKKVCDWLGIDMGEIIGSKITAAQKPVAAVHFRKDQAIAPDTAQALAQLIIAVQKNVISSGPMELR